MSTRNLRKGIIGSEIRYQSYIESDWRGLFLSVCTLNPHPYLRTLWQRNNAHTFMSAYVITRVTGIKFEMNWPEQADSSASGLYLASVLFESQLGNRLSLLK
jgi:hypothetical protein